MVKLTDGATTRPSCNKISISKLGGVIIAGAACLRSPSVALRCLVVLSGLCYLGCAVWVVLCGSCCLGGAVWAVATPNRGPESRAGSPPPRQAGPGARVPPARHDRPAERAGVPGRLNYAATSSVIQG